MIRSLLAHPLTRGLDLDAPETTAARRRIIREKPFLRRIYLEWYREHAASLPQGEDAVVELGSGAGFFAEVHPGAITSDVQPVPGVDLAVNAQELPFADGSLRAVCMTNLLHHVQDARLCLAEAARCVRPGGALSMIEPWVSAWSRFVYRYLHHEPFDPAAADWRVQPGGPLSAANGALPWIVFSRERARFERELPQWKVEWVRPMMPFRYLVSGGVSLRSLAPGWAFAPCRAVERVLQPAIGATAMFAHILLRRTSVQTGDCASSC